MGQHTHISVAILPQAVLDQTINPIFLYIIRQWTIATVRFFFCSNIKSQWLIDNEYNIHQHSLFWQNYATLEFGAVCKGACIAMGAAYCCEPTDLQNEANLLVESAGVFPAGHSENDPGLSKISEDARREEKARLKLLVRNFTSTAIRGVSCGCVDLVTGKVYDATYFIDRWLHFLTVESGGAQGMWSLKVAIGSIKGILRAEELPYPRYGTLQISLQPFVWERLLVLKFESNGKEQEIAITEADVLQCETFVTCMNILRLYAQNHLSNVWPGRNSEGFGSLSTMQHEIMLHRLPIDSLDSVVFADKKKGQHTHIGIFATNIGSLQL